MAMYDGKDADNVPTTIARSELDEPRSRGSGPVEREPSQTPSTSVPYLAPGTLRRVQVGDALLVHGSLPPAWLRARRGLVRPSKGAQ
jgi:hypothetical protein